MIPDTDLTRLKADLDAHEHRVRRRAIWLTIIPAAIALGLILVTGKQVADARIRLAAVADSAELLRAEIRARLQALDSVRLAHDSLAAQTRVLETWVGRRDTAAVTELRQTAAQEFSAAALRPRVYLHIVDETQRNAVLPAQRALEEAGFVVPGIELVEAGPNRSEVRFFRTEERPEAERIQQVAGRGSTVFVVRDLSARYSDASIRPGHFEIWFSSAFPFAEGESAR